MRSDHNYQRLQLIPVIGSLGQASQYGGHGLAVQAVQQALPGGSLTRPEEEEENTSERSSKRMSIRYISLTLAWVGIFTTC